MSFAGTCPDTMLFVLMFIRVYLWQASQEQHPDVLFKFIIGFMGLVR